MAKTFAQLKKERADQLAALTGKLKEASGQTFSDNDDRYWQPTVDKEGNGYAIIRFLPANQFLPVPETTPFVRIFQHGFQGPGGWYIENCLTTIGKEDPVAEYNNVLWNSTKDDSSPARKQARDQKRKLTFTSNIFVVEDPAHPENNGKVFLYKYGKKIFDKIKEKMEPEFPDEAPFNPFDLWDGANFKLKIRKVEGYRNYDRSEFDKPAPLSEDDDVLEKVWKLAYALQPIIDPATQFKPYAELKAKLNKVLGKDVSKNELDEPEPEVAAPRIKAKPSKAEDTVAEDVPPFEVDTESSEDIDFFKSLVER